MAETRRDFKRIWAKRMRVVGKLGLSADIKRDRAAVFPKLKKRFRNLPP